MNYIQQAASQQIGPTIDTQGQAVDTKDELNTSPSPAEDPFAAQRTDEVGSPLTDRKHDEIAQSPESPIASSPQDRRQSAEWDASKTPPSRFQKRKGSIYATPSSRDGHVDRNVARDAIFHATHAEKGYAKRRSSKAEP